MSVNNELETGMLAVIATLNFIINIAWFLIIASAIFSWLYAFNVINVNNKAINMIGRSLYQLTEPLYRPIRRFLPNMGGVDLSPLVVLGHPLFHLATVPEHHDRARPARRLTRRTCGAASELRNKKPPDRDDPEVF